MREPAELEEGRVSKTEEALNTLRDAATEEVIERFSQELVNLGGGRYHHPIFGVMANWVQELFAEMGAKNFVTVTATLGDDKTGQYEITIRRHEGIAPAEKLAELEAKIAELEKRAG